MTNYEVELNGQNYWLEVDGVPRRMGFYTLRYVEAVSPEDAARAAIRTLRSHESLANLLNEPSDSPKIYAEDVIELAEAPDLAEVDLSLCFYLDDDDA